MNRRDFLAAFPALGLGLLWPRREDEMVRVQEWYYADGRREVYVVREEWRRFEALAD